jgi:hypothetical protein
LDWAAANQAAAGLNDGDCNLTDGSAPGDWRLPTREEWIEVMSPAWALKCHNTQFFPPPLVNDPGTACFAQGPTSFLGVLIIHDDGRAAGKMFWSSNPDGPQDAYVSNHGFGDVHTTRKSVTAAVWPVRRSTR